MDEHIEEDFQDDQIELEEELNENLLSLIKPEKFDIQNFTSTFEDKTKEVLSQLQKMQSNSNPLKKGGSSIAYRCDVIILKNRQRFTTKGNTIYDIISGFISSNPDNDVYTITVEDVQKILNTKSKYVYEVMREGVCELQEKPFIFEAQPTVGKKKTIAIPLYSILAYESKKMDDEIEMSYISFKPSPFFKMMTLAASVVHGAYYTVQAASKISSNYSKQLYYFLCTEKNYREYPGATPGIIQIPLDELQNIIGYPESYTPAYVKRNVLETAYKQINSIPEIDFMFEYKMIKTRPENVKKLITTHVQFIITSKKVIEDKDKTTIEVEDNPVKISSEQADKVSLMQMLASIGLTEKQIDDVLVKYYANNRNMPFMIQAIAKVSVNDKIRSKTAVLCYMMDHGLNYEGQVEEQKQKSSNAFNQYRQNEFDFEELEKLLTE